MGLREVSQSELTFYGLTLQYKKYLHELIVNLSINVDGFLYTDWYEMPVNLRNYYVTIINDISNKKQNEIDKISKRK